MGTTKQKPKASGGEERALGVGTEGLFYTPQSAGSLHTPETCTQEREVTEQASSTNGRSLERPTWVVTKGKNTKMKWLQLMQNYDVVEYKQSTLIAVFGS